MWDKGRGKTMLHDIKILYRKSQERVAVVSRVPYDPEGMYCMAPRACKVLAYSLEALCAHAEHH